MFYKDGILPNIHTFLPLQKKQGSDWVIMGCKEKPVNPKPVENALKRMKRFQFIYSYMSNEMPKENIKFDSGIGLEMTFELETSEEAYKLIGAEYHLQILLLQQMGIHCYHDQEVIEVPTPIFYHSNDAILYYQIVQKLLGFGGFVSKNNWSTGGGCHVNIDGSDMIFVRNMFRVLYNRPWLQMVLLDWYDYDTAVPFCFRSNISKSWLYDFLNTKDIKNFLVGFNLTSLYETMMHYISEKKVIELRFFDMPETISGMQNIFKIVKHLCNLAKTEEPCQWISKSTCLDRLKNGVYLAEWFKFEEQAGIVYNLDNIKMRMEKVGVSKKKFKEMVNNLGKSQNNFERLLSTK